MNIKEKFYANLEMLREGLEKGNPNIVRLRRSQAAAQKALRHLNKNRYKEAHAAVEGTPLAKNLRSYLDRAQEHWTKMNVLNNSSRKAKSEEKYNDIRSRANDHQDQAQHHHDKAVEYLKSYSTMNEEEQLDELSDPTHMSYRAKARNQLDKMVNRLGSKMGSYTVNTKKMRNRAEGIKKSYKLQPKKK